MKQLKCPVCKKTINKEGNIYFPFCSGRCKSADLYSWLSGEYKISEPLKKKDSNDEKI